MKHTALAYRICDVLGVKNQRPRAEAQTTADVLKETCLLLYRFDRVVAG